MLAYERDERFRVLLPILWKAFKIGEHGGDSRLAEQLHCVFGVFVEVRVEDALILEVQSRSDVGQHPAEVVQPQRSEGLWAASDRVLDRFAIRPNGFFASLFDFGDDRKAIAGRRPRENGPIPTAL